MLAATFSLTNCTKEINNPQTPEVAGTPFEIVASAPDTKTVNNGMATEWVAGDAINLFHAVTDATTYTNDGSFKITTDGLAEGKFNGTLNGTLANDEEYDWYAFYPYSSYIETPANTGSGYMPVGCKSNEVQTQKGNSSMTHIAGTNYPLAGRAIAVAAGSTPEIIMAHVSSLIEIVVTNTVDTPLTVSSISFTAPEDIVGTYFINFAGETVSYKGSGDGYVSKTAVLEVKNGTALAKGESAKFYLAVKPFEAAVDTELTLDVNGCVKKIELASNVKFNAGKIKTLNFDYDKVAVPVGENTDVLNRALTGIDNEQSEYASWSGKSSNTTAVYAGQSAGTHDAIQLRSTNNNSGVITTQSGGYVRKIEVDWESSTSAGRVLNVYGRFSAYSSPEDLYSTATQGTLLGTITKGTSTSLIIDGNYTHFGLRSASGAMYISEIRIEWSDERMETSPLTSISVSGQKTQFNVGEAFSFNGVVTALYEDGTSKTVAPESVAAPDMNTPGTKQVVITYTEEGITKTCQYDITVSQATETWTQITSLDQIVSGEYVIVVKTDTKTGFLPSSVTSSAPTFNVNITINNNAIASVSDDMKFTFTVASQNDITIKNASGNYLYITNANNGVRVGTTSIKWKIASHDEAGTFKLTTTTVSRFLGVYNNQDWRCYATYNAGNYTNGAGSSAIYLYKKN